MRFGADWCLDLYKAWFLAILVNLSIFGSGCFSGISGFSGLGFVFDYLVGFLLICYFGFWFWGVSCLRVWWFEFLWLMQSGFLITWMNLGISLV